MAWKPMVKPLAERLDGRVHAAVSLKQRRGLERIALRREVPVSLVVREAIDLLLGQHRNGGKKPHDDQSKR